MCNLLIKSLYIEGYKWIKFKSKILKKSFIITFNTNTIYLINGLSLTWSNGYVYLHTIMTSKVGVKNLIVFPNGICESYKKLSPLIWKTSLGLDQHMQYSIKIGHPIRIGFAINPISTWSTIQPNSNPTHESDPTHHPNQIPTRPATLN